MNYAPFDEANKQVNNFQNGRVLVDPNENYKAYNMYVNQDKPQKCFQDSLRGVHELTSVSESFFSKENVELIQQKIIENVYLKSNRQYRISRQSDQNLQIIMRSIYFQYAKNLPCRIKEQVIELNDIVIEECTNIILPNIKLHITYFKDISEMPKTLEHAKNVSSKGTKTLSSKIGF